MTTELPLLQVSGTPRERGRAHGETFGGLIRELVPAFFDDLEHTSRAHAVTVMTREKTLEIVRTYVEPTRDYAPDLFEELEGISDAADVAVDDVLALNAFLELHDYHSDAFTISGCTSLMIPGSTSGEGALIAQNYDLASLFAEAAVLIEANWTPLMDEVWVTTSPEDQVVERLKGRNNMGEEAVRARINSQMSQEDRSKHADVVV